MADISIAPRIQFEGETHPVKTTGEATSSTVQNGASLSEEVEGYDLEAKAVQIADADLNHKKKQV